MRIAFVARHQEIRKIAQEVAKEMDLELTAILATPENCVEIVQDLIKKDYDVVVLWGGLHDIVQADSSIPSTRLVRCDALIGENLSCLFNARQLAASAHPTICSVGRPPLSRNQGNGAYSASQPYYDSTIEPFGNPGRIGTAYEICTYRCSYDARRVCGISPMDWTSHLCPSEQVHF